MKGAGDGDGDGEGEGVDTGGCESHPAARITMAAIGTHRQAVHQLRLVAFRIKGLIEGNVTAARTGQERIRDVT